MPFPRHRVLSALGGVLTLSASLFLAASPGSTLGHARVAPHPVKTDRELVPLTSVEKSKKIEQAIKDVNRRAVEGCEFYKREVGSGGM